MITDLEVTRDMENGPGVRTSFKLFKPDALGLVITSVEGCDSKTYSAQTSTLVGGVDRLSDFRTPSRTITVKYALTAWGSRNESARFSVNSTFPHGGWVELSLRTDSGRKYSIWGMVERIEQNSFSKEVVGAVYILCPYPFFVQTYGVPRPGISPVFVHGAYDVQFPITREPTDLRRYSWERPTSLAGYVLFGDTPTRPRIDLEFRGNFTPTEIFVHLGGVQAIHMTKPLFDALGVKTFGARDKLRFYYEDVNGLVQPAVEVRGSAIQKKINPWSVSSDFVWGPLPVTKPNSQYHWAVHYTPTPAERPYVDVGGVVGFATI